MQTDPEEGKVAERVHLVSLGCPKNRVDSEVMIGKIRGSDCVLVDTPEEAEVLIAAMRTAPIGPNGKINLLAHLKGKGYFFNNSGLSKCPRDH